MSYVVCFCAFSKFALGLANTALAAVQEPVTLVTQGVFIQYGKLLAAGSGEYIARRFGAPPGVMATTVTTFGELMLPSSTLHTAAPAFAEKQDAPLDYLYALPWWPATERVVEEKSGVWDSLIRGLHALQVS